jgi:mannose-1-phosphate guanylyltransferase
MILAAGLGTRLRPLTLELPKPLVPLGDRPVLAHVAERLAAGGVARAVVNTHHLPEAFTPERLATLPLPVEVLHEPVLLGTAGGLANAAAHLAAGDVVVWNGDIVIDLDVGALLEAHRRGGALATLAVAARPRGEGTVGVGAAGRVVRLRGEQFGDEVTGCDFVGVQVVGDAIRRALPREGCLVGDAYLPALRRGGLVATAPAPAAWDDIGTLATYRDAHARWLERRGARAFVAEGARVDRGVRLERSIVGAGAVVRGEGLVRACVVWPGATLEAPRDGVVVTTGGRVVDLV